VLFGKSGLGKTSLLQAGLFPEIRDRGLLPVYVRVDVADRSGPLIDQINQAFCSELRDRHIDAPARQDGESLWAYLHRSDLELWTPLNRPVSPLFVLDQFEEVFTRSSENREAVRRFRTDLADLLENRIPEAISSEWERLSTEAALEAGGALDVKRQVSMAAR
jgi:hypothetical protein